MQLRGGNNRFTGFMDVMVADDDGTPTSFQLPVDVGAKEGQRYTAYVRPGARESEIMIQLSDNLTFDIASARERCTLEAHDP